MAGSVERTVWKRGRQKCQHRPQSFAGALIVWDCNFQFSIFNFQSFKLAALLLAACLISLAHAGEPVEDDPTEPRAVVIALERPEQPLDSPAPASQFVVPDSQKLWRNAWTRAISPSTDHGGGFFEASQLLGEGFRSAKNFHFEHYAESEASDELQLVVAADEAVKEGMRVTFTRMRIIFFIGKTPFIPQTKPDKQKGGKKAQAHPAREETAPVKRRPARPDGPRKDKPAAAGPVLPPNLPYGGRVVITAPRAVIDLKTNEGRATGDVTIEIFPKQAAGEKDEPMAVLSSERLHWRTWSEPAIGSREIAIYTCSEKLGEPDPVVKGRYTIASPDGTRSTMLLEGRGMIYEAGTLDKLGRVQDDDGREIGLSRDVRNRAIFHNDIKMITTATTMTAFMPFQGKNAGGPARDGAKPPAAPPPPSRTVVDCSGPAVLDLAAPPRQKKKIPAAPGTEDAPAPASETLQQILLGRRFEFLNGVSLTKAPVDATGASPEAAADQTRVYCKHLCLQYPSGSLPTGATLPEYAEAVGGVKMSGTNSAGTADALAPAPAAPFSIDCERIYYDGLGDNIFLVGAGDKPVQILSDKGQAAAQQFCYRSRTQTLTMPSSGPKKLVIPPGAFAPPESGSGKPELFSLGAGETIVTWRGVCSREIKYLPVPRGPDRMKEILTLKDDVRIDQPRGGLQMRGKTIRLVRTLPSGDVDFLEGSGAVSVTMGKLQARGESVSVEFGYGKDGALTKNTIVVTGSRKLDAKATLFMEGNAIRADKFEIDRQADTFRALGGAVAVFKAPEAEAPAVPSKTGAVKPAGAAPNPAAQNTGALFKGISFEPGGNMMLQCDGEFSQDGAARTVKITGNVLIRQPGRQLFADTVTLLLDDPTPAPAGQSTPADALFSAKLKSIECSGNVDLTTDDQLIQCDRLLHDIKNDTTLLEVNDAENDVRIYMGDDSGGTRFLSFQKFLSFDSRNGKLSHGGMLMLPYRGSEPAPRDKNSSPVRRKAAGKPR